jgi:hypothetical protein
MQVMFLMKSNLLNYCTGSREVGDNSVGSLTKLLQTSNALGTSKMEFVKQ